MAVLVMITPLLLGSLAWAECNRRWGHTAPPSHS